MITNNKVDFGYDKSVMSVNKMLHRYKNRFKRYIANSGVSVSYYAAYERLKDMEDLNKRVNNSIRRDWNLVFSDLLRGIEQVKKEERISDG